MTKLSRWPVEKQKMSLFLDDFWTAVASLQSKYEARSFFSQFLTHTERKMFAKRFQIALMLLLGYDYQNIKNRIRVSDVTIAKISNWIEENREALINVAKRIIRLKNIKAERQERLGLRQKKTTGSALVEAGVGEMVKAVKQFRKESSLSD